MTAVAPLPTAAPHRPPPGPAEAWRRYRGPIAVGAVLVLMAVIVSLGARPERAGLLEPESSEPNGARALVAILRDEGADVGVARGTGAALDTVSGAGDAPLVVLSASHRLSAEQLDRIAGAEADVLAVRPTGPALDALAPGVEPAGRVDAGGLGPDCALDAADAAGEADLGGETYSGGTGCYPADGGSALVAADRENGARTWVLGTAAPLTNERLGRAGNAALALNLAAGRDVVWFLPDVPTEQGSQSPMDLVPRQLLAAAVPAGAALLLLALWQGRRLGPLVSERLPVVVRAAETTEGRAGLYASRRARDRAALALRTGAVERLRPRLGLGADAEPSAVADAAAQRLGEAPEQVAALLYGVPGDPADDAALVRLAADLDRLEERLR